MTIFQSSSNNCRKAVVLCFGVDKIPVFAIFHGSCSHPGPPLRSHSRATRGKPPPLRKGMAGTKEDFISGPLLPRYKNLFHPLEKINTNLKGYFIVFKDYYSFLSCTGDFCSGSTLHARGRCTFSQRPHGPHAEREKCAATKPSQCAEKISHIT